MPSSSRSAAYAHAVAQGYNRWIMDRYPPTRGFPGGIIIVPQDPERAVRKEVARERQGALPAALMRRALDRVLDEIRAHLPAEEYERILAEGRLLALADAGAEALAFPSTALLAAAVGGSEPPQVTTAIALTRQQLVGAKLIADGLSNPAIGATLKISRGTAIIHVQHILERLRLQNRAQIAIWYAGRSDE